VANYHTTTAWLTYCTAETKENAPLKLKKFPT